MRLLMHPSTGAENPFVNLLVGELHRQGASVHYLSNRNALRQRADAVMVHWPHNVVTKGAGLQAWRAGATLLLRLALQKLRGARVLWLVHDLDSPDRERNPRLKSLYMALFLRLLDGLVYMDASGKAEAERRHPSLAKLPAEVLFHPPFGIPVAQLSTPAAARARFGLPSNRRIVGFLGDIRDYKNLPELLAAFDTEPSDDLFFFIAGAFHRHARREPVEQGLQRLRERGVPFLFLQQRLDDQALGQALRACDLVVLPYDDRGPINSGFAVLALEHQVPLLVSPALAFTALARDVGPPWVQRCEGALQLATLRAALQAPGERQAAEPQLRSYFSAASWEAFASQLMGLVRRL